MPPLSARLLRLLSCRAAVKKHTTPPSSTGRDRFSLPCRCHSGLAKGTGEPHLRFPLFIVRGSTLKAELARSGDCPPAASTRARQRHRTGPRSRLR